MSEGLVKFLRARLDAEEQFIRASDRDPDAGLFSLNRMLREVEAKRATLALHKPDRDPGDQWYGHDVRCEECGYIGGSAASGERGVQRSWPCRTIRVAAAVYRDHPDYRQEWAP